MLIVAGTVLWSTPAVPDEVTGMTAPFSGKTLTAEQLYRVAERHAKWYVDNRRKIRRGVNDYNFQTALKNPGRAYLTEADLSGPQIWRDARKLAGRDPVPDLDAPAHDTRKRWPRLGWAEMSRANLQQADLARAELIRVVMAGADLRGADLRQTDMRMADLRGADLRGADLRRAYLMGARLNGAKLAGARLDGTFLGRADLTGVDLSEVDLSGAALPGAKLDRPPESPTPAK